ncbi:YeiH family putative sulfate export transporter [Kordiimonas sp. SCSIO 12603]|uniref:YeiH family protein n=1 Tax=Kordiimonas sp. SCSIO 12603 TaxID=2829596 RepID=UPI002106FDE9|nr:YeiH family protein [Kordiimonas sp. SCSIO 12603]UTW58289.1 YeiH family putative sulfate export transporter [Kordiimonas sp. SCSIO 12603]
MSFLSNALPGRADLPTLNWGTAKNNIPGVFLTLTLAMAATFVARSYGGPTMLFALLFGIAFNHLGKDTKYAPGIQFASKTILRIGVALLGVQLTVGELSALGAPIVVLVTMGVAVTIIGGAAIARALGLSSRFAVLTAGAVAICGASAALAISAVLPKYENKERHTILVVAGVTALSTIAMILYPVLTQSLGMDDKAAGMFLGATIHDVAQVIGAGYAISDTAGETGAVVKLMRVACLVPAVFMIGLVYREKGSECDGKTTTGPLLPLFLIGFLLLVGINSAGLIPEFAAAEISSFSRWCLVTAVAALGVKTNVKEILGVGPRPLMALSLQTIGLALFALCGLSIILM